jgi:hypothetical protein
MYGLPGQSQDLLKRLRLPLVCWHLIVLHWLYAHMPQFFPRQRCIDVFCFARAGTAF